MRTRLDRWGNSLGLRLPKAVVDDARLREGDQVEIDIADGAIVIRRARPRYTLNELLEPTTPDNLVEDAFADAGEVGLERFCDDD